MTIPTNEYNRRYFTKGEKVLVQRTAFVYTSHKILSVVYYPDAFVHQRKRYKGWVYTLQEDQFGDSPLLENRNQKELFKEYAEIKKLNPGCVYREYRF